MKRKLVFGGLAAALILGGCGARLPKMTDEQAKAIGEYAAISLLKHDANSRSRLVDLSQIEEPEVEAPAPEAVPTPEPIEEPEVPETPVIEIGEETPGADSMESFLELAEGMTVVYLGQELRQSYSEELLVEASPGKSLLVLNFQINNASGADQSVDLLNRRDVYRVTVNENYSRTSLATFLLNDMSAYMGTIPAGGSADVVLLFEVDQSQADSLASIVLNLKNESKTYTIQLL